MRLFKPLKQKIGYLDPKQVEVVAQAFMTAKEAHEGQKRKTGEPYITHPVAVACILADMKMEAETLMAALMHDVLEDTPLTKEDLTKKFGRVVAELVDGVTKLTQIEFRTKAEAQAEYLRKMVLAMSRDIRVILIKLADRLHNMRTLGHMPAHKQKRIALETLEIFSPIANRLGMREFADELDELGFIAQHPHRYRVLKEAIKKARGNRKEVFSVIKRALETALKNSGIAHTTFEGREKHVYSLYKKMRNKKLSFSNITDIYGFRVVVDTIDDCYRALGVFHSVYKPVPERFKDYIAIPKANGYQSLHTILFGPYGVPIEIQIRSKEMDIQANSGIAAHWLYKSADEDLSQSQVRAQQWVKDLIEMQKRTGNSLEFVENVKIDLFPDEVYVFTPQGDIMELPKGATVIDFAYAVHTDIGNACSSAKINQKAAVLSTVLSSGQTVEIKTSRAARPSPDWLNFVVTGKARSSIRHFLKSQKEKESITLGKQLLSHALKNLNIKFRKVSDELWQKILEEIQVESLDRLFAEIGLGHRPASLEAHRVKAMQAHLSLSIEEGNSGTEDTPLFIKGTEGMVVEFAACCCPIPGDLIAGIFKKGQGMLVHVQNCKFAKRHVDSTSYVLLSWSEEVVGEFSVMISVDVLDQRGILADMAVAISMAGSDIDDVQIKERSVGGYYKALFRIKVKDRAHLATVIRRLRKLKPVLHIVRERP